MLLEPDFYLYAFENININWSFSWIDVFLKPFYGSQHTSYTQELSQ